LLSVGVFAAFDFDAVDGLGVLAPEALAQPAADRLQDLLADFLVVGVGPVR
jgi:hypothetical protein